MILLLSLFPLLLPASQAALTPCSAKQSQPGAPCVLAYPRMEVRELAPQRRRLMVEAFRDMRHRFKAEGRRGMLEEPEIYRTIRQLDERLRAHSFMLPYWDARVDRRLPNPADSIIFDSRFISMDGRRKREKKRGRSRRRRGELLGPLRRARHNPLLFLLHQIGAVVMHAANESCSSLCPPHNEWMVCDSSLDRCVSRISPGGNCTGFENNCLEWTCIEGLCTDQATSSTSVPSTTPVQTPQPASIHRPQPKKRRKERNGKVAARALTTPQPIRLHLDRLRPLIDSFATADLPVETTVEGSGAQPDDFPTPAPLLFIELIKNEYETPYYFDSTVPTTSTVSSMNPFTTVPTTTVIDSSEEDYYLPTVASSSAPITRHSLLQPASLNALPKNVISWNQKAPFPTAYFTVSVIEGEWRRKPRHGQRIAKGVTIYSTGANLPSGYTQSIQGAPITDSPFYVMQVLNPSSSGYFVEVNITSTDVHGNECEQFCLHPRKGSYKPCDRTTVRLSRYEDFSDPIQWYQTEKDAINSQWTGAGYFRKQKQNYILFKCRSQSKNGMKRRQLRKIY